MTMLAKAAAKPLVLLLSFLAPVLLLAQEGGAKIEADINKSESAWYTNPLIWMIGAVVFILLLIALLRGNNAPKS